MKGRTDPKAVIIASPIDGNDSILLPTAADIGQKIEPIDAATTAADAERAKPMADKLVGEYGRYFGEKLVKLRIDTQTIVAKGGPMTLEFQYKPVNFADGTLSLELNAENMDSLIIEAFTAANGILTIHGKAESLLLAGDWIPMSKLPATRPARPTTKP